MRNIKAVRRIRSKISGTAQRPRLCLSLSLKHARAQLIDDTKGAVLAYVSTESVKELDGKSMSQKTEWLGEKIAEAGKKAKVKAVVFDRGGKIYHGRVKIFAESARKNGLEF